MIRILEEYEYSRIDKDHFTIVNTYDYDTIGICIRFDNKKDIKKLWKLLYIFWPKSKENEGDYLYLVNNTHGWKVSSTYSDIRKLMNDVNELLNGNDIEWDQDDRY